MKFNQLSKKLLLIMICSLLTACADEETQEEISTETSTEVSEPEETIVSEVFQPEPDVFYDIVHKRIAVHDPSIIKANGAYYIYGSHRAWAKSEDLISWTGVSNNISTDYEGLLKDIWEEYCKTPTNPNLAGNMWAPDMFYNETMGKYCMYMSVNGDDWNSCIVLLTADSIDGPFEYAGEVVFSGFTNSEERLERSDVYKVLSKEEDLSRYKSTKNTKLNAIDPCVKYDEEGNLWMAYGSWFGGIYLLKLDSETGLRDYTYTYETLEHQSDAYHGIKIAGGQAVSGEGAYILEKEGYYYLFLSYGGLITEGGYQMRVFRSENITGPYMDQVGNSAVYEKAQNNLLGSVGVRLMGSYQFSGNDEIHAAQGHNSAFVDEDGKIFVVYHTRFAGGKNGIWEAHEVRVQQLFVTKSGWLVAAPYEYAGETMSEEGYQLEQMTGEYEFVVHTPYFFYQRSQELDVGIAETITLNLHSDLTVSGDKTGVWSYDEGSSHMTITVDGITYEGVFVKAVTEGTHKEVTTFTAIGNNVCVWGSKK